MLVFPINGEAKQYETLTASDVAQTLTLAKLNTPAIEGLKGLRCRGVLITVEDNSINITIDGTTPTATAGTNIGHLINVGQSFLITGWENVKQTKFINSVAGSNGTVKASYYF